MEENKTLEILAPEGYEIDKEKSTFEKIVFKPVEKCWRYTEDCCDSEWINGYRILDDISKIVAVSRPHIRENRSIFATEKQAKSALAMAQISQIMKNDPRFGGHITHEEWGNCRMIKYVVCRYSNEISMDIRYDTYEFIAFHTAEQRDLFFKENRDLVLDYLMLD